METKNKIKELEQKKEFMEWKEKNKEAILSFVLRIIEEPPNDEWQIGFYNIPKNNITTFVLKGTQLTINPDEEIFKKEEQLVKELQLEKVKIGLVDAAKIAQDYQKKEYPSEMPTKVISILQHLTEFGNVWNFSFVSRTFNTLNIKINTENGKVIDHSISKIFEFT